MLCDYTRVSSNGKIGKIVFDMEMSEKKLKSGKIFLSSEMPEKCRKNSSGSHYIKNCRKILNNLKSDNTRYYCSCVVALFTSIVI